MQAMQNILAWAYFLAFVVYVLAISYVLSMRPLGRPLVLLAVLLGLMAHWALALSVATVATDMASALLWRRISSVGWGTNFSVLLHLCLLFTGHEALARRHGVLVLLYAPAAVNVAVFGLLGSIASSVFALKWSAWGWVTQWVPNVWHYWYTLCYMSFGVVSITLTWRWGRRSSDPVVRRQSTLLFRSFLLAALLGVAADALLPRLADGSLPWLSIIIFVVPVGTMLIAIHRYGFANAVQPKEVAAKWTLLSDRDRARMYRQSGLFVLILGLVNTGYRVLIVQDVTAAGFWLGGMALAVATIAGGLFIMNAHRLPLSTGKQEAALALLLAGLLTSTVLSYQHSGALTVWALVFPFLMTSVVFSSIKLMLATAALQVGVQMYLLVAIGVGPSDVNLIDYLVRMVTIGYTAYILYQINGIYASRLRENEERLRFQTSVRDIAWHLRANTGVPFEETINRVLKALAAYLRCDTACLVTMEEDAVTSVLCTGSAANASDMAASASSIVQSHLPGTGLLHEEGPFTILRDNIQQDDLLRSHFQRKGLADITVMPIDTVENERHFLLVERKLQAPLDVDAFEDILRITGDGIAGFLRAKASRAALQHLAYHNPLTQLPNRMGFLKLLKERLQTASHMYVFFIQLDGIHEVLDIAGLAAGDQATQYAASLLQQQLKEDEALGVFSGNSLLLMAPLTSEAAADERARALISALQCDMPYGRLHFPLLPCIGIAACPGDSREPEALLHFAGFALSHARNTNQPYAFYSAQKWDEARDAAIVRQSLGTAIERDELSLHYQPQINLATGRIVGLEALLRWRHGRLGHIAPSVFIPMAEENDMMEAIGGWALAEACRQAQAWREDGLPPVRIGVNVSFRQLTSPQFLDILHDALQRTGFDPAFLELEITESTSGTYSLELRAVMAQLKEVGVTLAIDDYGADYSGLRRLSELPVDRIKIDKSITDRLLHPDERGQTIIQNIVRLAQDLNIRTLAEGAEHEQQITLLQTLGCEEVQGYYFHRPLSAEDAGVLLREQARNSESG